ncbi:hypothetical protein QVD17_01070 [Tagetes erecta]|uniref:F-box associated domain-containing protein n=1 Tax=Tagetes erecta TaxID=13708 RepID=A0AAD8L6Y6_TARER|nr:hypothetical protein QVD17_01070 [Tagetes erecta]
MKQTCVQMLSLKSNVWRVIGDLKYTFIRRVGMLWDGALHWIIRDQNHKEIIISYDLSKQEFKEIPRPDYDTRYEATSNSHRGIIKECLCIYRSKYVSKWRMKYHESWEQLPDHCERRYNFGHYNKFPVFVQSLVSPHVNQREGKQRRSFGSWIKCLSLMLLDTLHRDRGDPTLVACTARSNWKFGGRRHNGVVLIVDGFLMYHPLFEGFLVVHLLLCIMVIRGGGSLISLESLFVCDYYVVMTSNYKGIVVVKMGVSGQPKTSFLILQLFVIVVSPCRFLDVVVRNILALISYRLKSTKTYGFSSFITCSTL